MGYEKLFGVESYRLITFIFFELLIFWVILSLFGPFRAIFGAIVDPKSLLGFLYIDLQLLFSEYCSILVLSCSLSLWWWWVVGCFLVSQPTLSFVVVEVGVGL